jgi:hypothetical protein
VSEIISRPPDIDLPEDKDWQSMSPQLRHYYRNKSDWKERIGQRKQELRKWLWEKQSNRGCKDCGESHVAALQWHHLNPDDKDRSPATMAKHGCCKERIEMEIEKCVVLCANCHAKLHWEEQH